MELVRATEAAAIRATPLIGRGDKNAADGAAVDAMRKFLGTVNFDGVIVIGEGEKDNAPDAVQRRARRQRPRAGRATSPSTRSTAPR